MNTLRNIRESFYSNIGASEETEATVAFQELKDCIHDRGSRRGMPVHVANHLSKQYMSKLPVGSCITANNVYSFVKTPKGNWLRKDKIQISTDNEMVLNIYYWISAGISNNIKLSFE